jgi:hypothetical protein
MAPRATRTTIAPPPPAPVQTGEDGRPIVPPPVVPDVITRLAPATNTVSDTGHTTIIDVQPDFRFPISSWIYSISHSVQNSAYATHPLASPASLVAYTLALFTGLLFQSDAFLRFDFSAHASQILNDDSPRTIFSIMPDLLVPSFASADFEAFMVHMDPLAENLAYFGTLAGSTLLHDFGRIIPISFFVKLHNLLSELPQNLGTLGLSARFFLSEIASFRHGTADYAVTPAHFTSATFDAPAGTHNTYRNWFFQYIDRLMLMNATRVVNATATITRIHMDEPARYSHAIPTSAEPVFNPYLFAISYTPNNRYGLFELLRNMNDFVRTTFPNSKPLRAYTQIGTQPEIVRHLSFNSILPTWHTLGVKAYESTPSDATKNIFSVSTPSVSHATFASAINFLVDHPTPADTTTPPSVPVIRGAQPPAPNNQDVMIQLVAGSQTNPAPSPNQTRLFDELKHVIPRMMIFDPTESSTAHLAAVITSGKLIETNDISLIGVPTPDATRSLGLQNSQYILGAIQMRYIKTAESQAAKIVRRRNFGSLKRVAQHFVQSSAHLMLLPLFRPGLVTPLITVTPPGNKLAGFLPNVATVNQTTNAANGVNTFSTALGSQMQNVPAGHFILWSSYRFYDVETQTWYMLPTLRHIYGTRARLFSSEHISLRLH